MKKTRSKNNLKKALWESLLFGLQTALLMPSIPIGFILLAGLFEYGLSPVLAALPEIGFAAYLQTSLLLAVLVAFTRFVLRLQIILR